MEKPAPKYGGLPNSGTTFSERRNAQYLKFRMRCGRIIVVLNTPQVYEQARRNGWVQVK